MDLSDLSQRTRRRMEFTFRKKRLAVVGPEGSGKTTIQNFIRLGKLLKRYEPTRAPEETPRSKYFPDRDGQFGKVAGLKKGYDVAGDLGRSGGTWKEEVQKATFILFTFNVHKLLSDPTYGEVLTSYSTTVSKFLREKYDDEGSSRNVRFVFTGTHCDLEPDFRSSYGDPLAHHAFASRIYVNESIKKCLAVVGGELEVAPNVCFGSMVTQDQASELVLHVWKFLTYQQND